MNPTNPYARHRFPAEIISKMNTRTIQHERLLKGLRDIYEDCNTFNDDYFLWEFASVVVQVLNYWIKLENLNHNLRDTRILNCTIAIMRFLVDKGGFDLYRISDAEYEERYTKISFENLNQEIFDRPGRYGYDSVEVDYGFLLLKNKSKDKITPPEHIPDEVLELFRPISNNVALD